MFFVICKSCSFFSSNDFTTFTSLQWLTFGCVLCRLLNIYLLCFVKYVSHIMTLCCVVVNYMCEWADVCSQMCNGVISESVFFLYLHCKSIWLLRERIQLYDKEVGFKLHAVIQTGLVVWEGSANLQQGGILCQCYFSPVSPTHLNQQRSVCHVTLLISSSQFAQLCIC